uniref:NADH dehydrogenase subunit 2 n=1 Tax=Ayyaria chaetophora TaxID=1291247 RepID=UPI0030DF17D7
MKTTFISQKFLFYGLLIFSLILSISSDSILVLWMSLEMNLFAFLTTLVYKEMKKIEESLMIYFIMQTISSNIFIFSTIMMKMNLLYNYFILLMMTSMIMKLGLFPFHFWMISSVEKMSWTSCMILLTIQKMIPLIILMSFVHYKMFSILLIFNSLILSITGLMTLSLRKILTYSSLNHLTLMMFSTILSKKIMKMYFMLYLFMSVITMKIFETYNMNFILQTFLSSKEDKFLLMSLTMVFLSLIGIPPFLGFLPKLLILMKMIETKLLLMTLVYLFSSVISSFFYIRVFMTNLIMNFSMTKWKSKKKMINFSIFMTFLPIFTI